MARGETARDCINRITAPTVSFDQAQNRAESRKESKHFYLYAVFNNAPVKLMDAPLQIYDISSNSRT